MYVIDVEYLVDLEDIEMNFPAHQQWLKVHFDKGSFIAAGRKASQNGAIIIAKGMPRDMLDGILKDDPFLGMQMTRYRVVEFTPNLALPVLQEIGAAV